MELRGGRGQKGIPIDRSCAIGENAAQRNTVQPWIKGTTHCSQYTFVHLKIGECVNTGVIRLKTGRERGSYGCAHCTISSTHKVISASLTWVFPLIAAITHLSDVLHKFRMKRFVYFWSYYSFFLVLDWRESYSVFLYTSSSSISKGQNNMSQLV